MLPLWILKDRVGFYLVLNVTEPTITVHVLQEIAIDFVRQYLKIMDGLFIAFGERIGFVDQKSNLKKLFWLYKKPNVFFKPVNRKSHRQHIRVYLKLQLMMMC